ncbi:hypothetical protein PMAYCL1PPCAC_02945, partial [Pristionchus mayeri]
EEREENGEDIEFTHRQIENSREKKNEYQIDNYEYPCSFLDVKTKSSEILPEEEFLIVAHLRPSMRKTSEDSER